MKPCRFRDPLFAAAYFDGVMDEATEHEYSRHLLTCRACAEDLLNLERDLFLMETVEHSMNPRRVARQNALLRLGKNGLELLKRLGGDGSVSPLVFAPVRGGGEGESGCRWERAGVQVDVLPALSLIHI